MDVILKYIVLKFYLNKSFKVSFKKYINAVA